MRCQYQHICIIISLLLLGCTNKELYQVTQDQARINCNNKVGVEREDCLKALNEKSYDDYEQERQAIIKGQ